MTFCLFLTANKSRTETCLIKQDPNSLLSAIPGVIECAWHVPLASTHADPFIAAERSPECVIQLYFGRIDQLEAALQTTGPLASLVSTGRLAGYEWQQQAMLVRSFSDTRYPPTAAVDDERVTYLVEYAGQVANEAAWVEQYLRQHPPLLAKLPCVREVEVYTRLDYCSRLPVERSTTLQRNKVVFDSADALDQALASPQREVLRKDFLSLPPFSGSSPHYPMRTYQYRSA